MCSYCGCESEAVIAELMGEHAAIASMVDKVSAALHRGDRSGAESACAAIAAMFARHGRMEEDGLFSELGADPIATDTVAELEQDHRRLYEGLARVPTASAGEILEMLAELLDHANREDTDVFPTALQVLPDRAWERIADVHRAARQPAA